MRSIHSTTANLAKQPGVTDSQRGVLGHEPSWDLPPSSLQLSANTWSAHMSQCCLALSETSPASQNCQYEGLTLAAPPLLSATSCPQGLRQADINTSEIKKICSHKGSWTSKYQAWIWIEALHSPPPIAWTSTTDCLLLAWQHLYVLDAKKNLQGRVEGAQLHLVVPEGRADEQLKLVTDCMLSTTCTLD